MPRMIALALLLAVSTAVAQDSKAVEYSGGTVPNLKTGTSGRLDTTNSSYLAFEYSSGKLLIPFDKVGSYQYTKEVVHHLGVLPAIAVGMVRARKRSHFVRIIYRDDNNASQVAVLKVPKEMPRTLLPVLQARTPQPPPHPEFNPGRKQAATDIGGKQ